MHCIPGSRGVADITSVTMPLLSIQKKNCYSWPCCCYTDQHSVSDPGADQLIQDPEWKGSWISHTTGKEGNEPASQSSKVCKSVHVQ